ncbi:MAG TPA: iron ABC transporter permease [Rectinema sp.]|jgi:iron(III) transport system permease protein|nr:iron ABC transporter permease [Spirochaetia bacterium]HNV18316.1 iron ABC transporter permease [Rectinema sp.]HNY98897.1 iron ABC transporter permease [Rectinema sp.]HPB07967.1 iron ABC transporter permease [Rectinema sp.]HPV58561.1 iron ABC transporter permease [Rectinema sp.]
MQVSGFRARTNIKRLARDPVLLAVILLVTASLAIFILYPLVEVATTSLDVGGGRLGFGVYAEVVKSAYIRKALYNSLLMSTLTAIVGTIIGFIFAFAVVRAKVPLARFFNTMAVIPIVSPPFIGALAIIMLFGNNGLISWNLLKIQNFPIYGFNGLFIAQVVTFFPVSYLTLKGVLESMNPILEDAALDLGGTRWKVFKKVTLPLAIPGIASSVLLLFVETLADFGNPLILAGSRFPMLSVQAYLQIVGMYDLPKGAAISILLLVPSLIAFYLQRWLVGKRKYTTVTGKPQQSTTQIVSPGARAALFVACLIIALLVAMIYFSIVVGAFAKVWGYDHRPTLDHFKFVFGVGFKAVRDTLIIAGTATPFAGLLGMVIAYLVMRVKFPGRSFVESVSMLSFAVPGTVIGIGYILAFNHPPLVLTGTLTILLLNFVFRYIPVGIESGKAILSSIDPSIEEAAINLGADSRKTFTKVTLPMILPAFFSGLVFAFVRGMTAVSAAIFLVSSRWNLMTVHIMAQVESGNLGAAAAYSLLLVLIVIAAISLIRVTLKTQYAKFGGSMLHF